MVDGFGCQLFPSSYSVRRFAICKHKLVQADAGVMCVQLLLSPVPTLRQPVRRQAAVPMFPLNKSPISPERITPKISSEMMYVVSVLFSTVPTLSGEGQEVADNKTLVTVPRGP